MALDIVTKETNTRICLTETRTFFEIEKLLDIANPYFAHESLYEIISGSPTR